MVGIVVVSHSREIAEGVVALAREMAGEGVALLAVGGAGGEPGTLGTDATEILSAIESAYSDDGVLVLMDLGSAVLSAELALDLFDEEMRSRVLLCDAPLVEGAVGAATAARLGLSLEEVAAEARAGLRAKTEHLGSGSEAPPVAPHSEATGEERTLDLPVRNKLGLHARPAALLVRTAGEFDAEVEVIDLTTGRGPASARSLSGIATLGVVGGHDIRITARGPQADGALAALRALAERNFGDRDEPATEVAALARAPEEPAEGVLAGLAASPGGATGPARRLRRMVVEIPKESATDPSAELRALEDALTKARREVEADRSSVAARAGEYEAAIFDAHLLLLLDEELLGAARAGIVNGLNAAMAWDEAVRESAAAYEGLADEYQRARARDVTDVGRRVLAHLLGRAPKVGIEGPGIVVADELTPADAASLDTTSVRGIATAFGGPLSHGAILARALGLPAVVGLGPALLEIEEGTRLALDGESGVLYVDADEKAMATITERAVSRTRLLERARANAHDTALTRDGVAVEVAANAGSLEDVSLAVAEGADGIGLLRTEFLYLNRASLPDEAQQYEIYTAMAEILDGRPLIIRTLDVGADKMLPYLALPAEDNPFLGVRGIRLTLNNPQLFLPQLRAVLRTAENFPVKVMFPMVGSVDEARRALRMLAEARAELGLRDEGSLEVGAMVEVPAMALMARRFAEHLDFFSIGTNDLTQYALAADRGNSALASLADPLHPSVLRLVRAVAEAADAAGRWIGVCGEAAGDAQAIPLFVGAGVRELSASPPLVPLVKERVRAVDSRTAAEVLEYSLSLESAEEVRESVVKAFGDLGGPEAGR